MYKYIIENVYTDCTVSYCTQCMQCTVIFGILNSHSDWEIHSIARMILIFMTSKQLCVKVTFMKVFELYDISEGNWVMNYTQSEPLQCMKRQEKQWWRWCDYLSCRVHEGILAAAGILVAILLSAATSCTVQICFIFSHIHTTTKL